MTIGGGPTIPPLTGQMGTKRHTIEAFVKAYATVGFSLIDDDNYELEVGIEKVAIYVDSDGIPSHAARQLEDGSWTSKLGEWEDIQHRTLSAVEDKGDLGLGYGKVAVILRKQRPL